MATSLWLVRHGESVGNVAATRAEREGLESVELEYRDADVPLSEVGAGQARALGEWLREQETPVATFVSPYLRARQTYEIAVEAAGLEGTAVIDERLRDRELGVLDLLTARGAEVRHPDEAARRRWLGKYYYRPPGGESWADLALRLRSFLRDVPDSEGPVLGVAHDAVVTNIVALCLGMGERELLDFSRAHPVANASVTRLTREGDGWRLHEFADAHHLEAEGAPQTLHQGDNRAEIH
jgi:broad specificity phosphatase PhoE